MSQINVDDETKERFDEMKPEDDTQAEFAKTILESYEQHGEGVNPERWAEKVGEQIAESWANKVELGAFRGAKDAIEGEGKT